MKYGENSLRHEIKFYINYKEYYVLREKLKFFLNVDKNSLNGRGYEIRSLYFDDFYDSAKFEKDSGLFKRAKYRIRIYNKSKKVIKLECKRKYDQYVSKTSVLLTYDEFYNILNKNYEFLSNSKDQLKINFYLELKRCGLRPKVIVDYVREAFIHNAGEVRITFDKWLKAGSGNFDIFDSKLIVYDILDSDKLVLEVKYNDFLPGFIKGLIQISSAELSAISKYVMCRDKIINLCVKF